MISRYLSGLKPGNLPVSWPGFPGSTLGANLGTKYNARQIDSITVQILDTMRRGAFTDLMGNFTVPTYLPKGWRSGQPVMGIGRGPVLTEVLLAVETSPDPGTGAVPQFRVNQLTLEFYLPEGFATWLMVRGIEVVPDGLRRRIYGAVKHRDTGAFAASP